MQGFYEENAVFMLFFIGKGQFHFLLKIIIWRF